MDRQEIMAMLAEWFGVEPNEDGEYDINDYDWCSGCSMGNSSGIWLTLGEVVRCLEANL